MITNIKQENLLLIPYKDLYLSKHNVRTVPASKQEDKLLKASIKAQNIKQNLVVIKDGKKFGVIAGGRRYTQVGHLVNDGHYKSNQLIPCLVEKAENVIAVSLAENIKASMHPADEFVAFQAMIDEGKSVASIASEFAVPQSKIKQRLKMANISPEILDFYREDKIELDHIMAFTVSDDHERQLACYKELKLHNMSARGIKSFLLDNAILVEHGMVKLVTLKAFKNAGGTTTTDMFESETYVNERELIETMALEKLNRKAQSLINGWKWVDVSLTANSYNDYQTSLSANFSDVPDALKNDLKAKEKALSDLNNKPFSDWTEKDDALEDKLDVEIEALESKREQYRVFTDKQKAVSGVMVSFDASGTIVLKLGLVKKDDMVLAFPPTKKSDDGLGDKTENKPADVESNALKFDLHHFHLQAVQSEIMKDDKLTYDLMVFSLVKQGLNADFWCEKPLNTKIENTDFSATSGIDETAPFKDIEKFKNSLGVSWLSQRTEAKKFSAFRALSSVQKKRLLSYVTALVFNSNDKALNKAIYDDINFDISEHWTASKENYFKRIKTADLLKIGTKVIGKKWGVDNAKLSKGQLVDALSTHEKMAGWLPKSMTV